jgi:monothiol glutaredoxin
MSRLAEVPHAATATAFLDGFHPDVVRRVADAVRTHEVVVVGMAWNPFVPKARKALDEAGIPHHDLDLGNYTNMWRERLAVKLWAGWPTFPMVFVKGTLVGGNSDVRAALDDGTLKALREAPRAWPVEASPEADGETPFAPTEAAPPTPEGAGDAAPDDEATHEGDAEPDPGPGGVAPV